MSKKDKQHQRTLKGKIQQAETLADMKAISDDSLPPGTVEIRGANGTVARIENIAPDAEPRPLAELQPAGETPPTQEPPPPEENCQELRAELDQASVEIGHLRSELSLAQGVNKNLEGKAALLEAEVELVEHVARHGSLPPGKESAEGAVETIRILAQTALNRRTDLESAQEKAKALHSDLMVLEQTAAGRAPDIALQTDIGKRAAHELSGVLTMMDKLGEDRRRAAGGDVPLPATGWASDTARQLVEAVPPHERALLLGDLLAQLLPHTGEDGKNETASDVLKRIVLEVDMLRVALSEAKRVVGAASKRHDETSERMVKIQSAMVARRAPDAEAGALLEALGAGLTTVARDMCVVSSTPMQILPIFDRLAREWRGLRGFFSEAPLTAVAVRDDGHKGPVRERYSLLFLRWDGKAVSTRVVEANRPWGDIRPYMDQTMRHLIPGAYR